MTIDQVRSLAERDAKFQIALSNGLGWPTADGDLVAEMAASGLIREYTAAVQGAIAAHMRMCSILDRPFMLGGE